MNRPCGTALRAATRIACALLLALPSAAAAQSAAIAGRVLDATSGRPVAAAVVTLEPVPGGLVVDPGSMTLAATRTVVTTETGAYRFDELAAGRYRLTVQRLGYRGSALEAEVRRPVVAGISVALELEPVALEPVLVHDRAAAPFQRSANGLGEPDAARVTSERARQDAFLTPDARMLTYADVMDGVTLGEADVFRALQRFAGVATRDDYTAELWSRGAPWSQTRVTFDGLPLFNPVHAVGVLSAITPEVLGVVFFHPGVRPVSSGEGVAAVVDLRSRPGGGHGVVRGVADVSMASAKVALEQRMSDDGAAWLVAARRSWFDVLERGADWLRMGDVDLPYVFHDVTGRLDVPLGDGAALEVSGLWEEDRLYGDVEGVLERTRARWGNRAGRMTLDATRGGLRTRHTAGVSRYAARIQEFDAVDRRGPPPWAEPRSENDILFARLAGDFAPAPEAGSASPAAWSLGYEAAWRDLRYDGPQPRYHPVKPDTIRRITRSARLFTAALWAEARFATSPRFALSPGVRIEAGRIESEPALRVAPALALRWTHTPDRHVSFALGRSWQYEQAIALAGPSPHPAFHASQYWILAGRNAPAVHADIGTLGVEQWLRDGWLANVTVWARRARGIALPDPTPGPLVRRPLFVTGENHAHGVDASMRRIGARWSAALAWSWGESRMRAAGLGFPAPADRRHAVDVLAGVRLPAGFRVAGAYTAMTGSPFTRALSPMTEEECSLFGFECSTTSASVQEPGAQRTPAYASLDASLQWRGSVRGVELSAYAQVRNLLDRDNATTYSGTGAARRVTRTGESELFVDDRFERGLPRLPLIGARIAF